MKTIPKEITISKGNLLGINLNQYETLEELLTNEDAATILDYFNYRHASIQAQEHKKNLKPRKISIKEKRNLAFNLFSKSEIKKLTGHGELFEEMLQKNLAIIGKKIADGEIT